MKKNTLKLGAYLLLVGILGFTSCQKEEVASPNLQKEDQSQPKAMGGANVHYFRVGLQLTDHGTNPAYAGPIRYSNWVGTTATWSPWAADNNCYDPDAIQLFLDKLTLPIVIGDQDFRIGFQAADDCSSSQRGTVQWTPWASSGSGWTGLVSDGNLYDPDSYRVIIQTRPWYSNRTLRDFRLGIQVFDDHGASAGAARYTPWISAGGGSTGWATDGNAYDPDGFKVYLHTKF